MSTQFVQTEVCRHFAINFRQNIDESKCNQHSLNNKTNVWFQI